MTSPSRTGQNNRWKNCECKAQEVHCRSIIGSWWPKLMEDVQGNPWEGLFHDASIAWMSCSAITWRRKSPLPQLALTAASFVACTNNAEIVKTYEAYKKNKKHARHKRDETLPPSPHYIELSVLFTYWSKTPSSTESSMGTLADIVHPAFCFHYSACIQFAVLSALYFSSSSIYKHRNCARCFQFAQLSLVIEKNYFAIYKEINVAEVIATVVLLVVVVAVIIIIHSVKIPVIMMIKHR